MKIWINDQEHQLAAAMTVSELLGELALPRQGIAVALNQAVLPASQWQGTRLNAGDTLHLFSAIAGG